MITVQLTSNLHKYFPRALLTLEAKEVKTVLGILQQMDLERPQFSSYIIDESNSVRRHVNIFVNNMLLPKDEIHRKIVDGDRVHIMQALSGG
jgi:sulfur-carrier protein